MEQGEPESPPNADTVAIALGQEIQSEDNSMDESMTLQSSLNLRQGSMDLFLPPPHDNL